MNEEQLKKLKELAAEDDPARLASFVEAQVRERADAVVAKEVAGLKEKRDEIFDKLVAYQELGKAEDVKTQLAEIETLRKAAKGKGKADPKELEAMATELAESKIEIWKGQEVAQREAIEKQLAEERAVLSRAEQTIHHMAVEADLRLHAGTDVPGPLWNFYVQKLEPCFQPPTPTNGARWWEPISEGRAVSFAIVDPESDRPVPLTGKEGAMRSAELVQVGREGAGNRAFSDADFRNTFFPKQAKGAGGESLPAGPAGPKLGADASGIELIAAGIG